MRIFYAIEFSDEIKSYLQTIQQEIKRNCTRGNYVNIDNFHLTVQYIGEVEVSDVRQFIDIADHAVSNMNTFDVNIDNKIGKFKKQSRSIILTVIERSIELNNLYDTLHSSLAEFGVDVEKRNYVPHVTMGRNILMQNSIRELSVRIKKEKKVQLVDKLTVMESTRIGGRLKYLPLHRAKF